jgi:hypothetical protein
MLHVVLGLILLIFLVCNPDLVRRATGVRARRRTGRRLSCAPLPTGIPETGSGRIDPWRKPVASIPPPPQKNPYKTPFIRSFEPFKAEKKFTTTYGTGEERNNYPYQYGSEFFRSLVEVEWARTFDRLGLQ